MEGSYKYSGVDETARVEPVPPADDIDPGVSLKPLLKALEEVQYPGLVQLHVWHFPLKENIDASAGSLVRAPPIKWKLPNVFKKFVLFSGTVLGI